jgi:hypothetical protein
MENTILTWNGKQISPETPSEELYEIIKSLAQMLESERDNHQRTLAVWGEFNRARG